MSEISIDDLRLQAVQLAAQTNPSGTHELLANADKILNWITKKAENEFSTLSPSQIENHDPEKNKIQYR
jgi:hypothetical protein